MMDLSQLIDGSLVEYTMQGWDNKVLNQALVTPILAIWWFVAFRGMIAAQIWLPKTPAMHAVRILAIGSQL